MNEIITNVLYLDFINKIDLVIFDLLYSSQKGYFNLKSIDAIENYYKYFDDFDIEIQKIINEILKSRIFSDKIENDDKIIEEKKAAYKNMLDEHFKNQLQLWADDVFSDTIEGILFKVSLNKNSRDIREKLYSKAISVISWMNGLKQADDSIQKASIDYFNKRYIDAIKSDFSEFIPKTITSATNPDKYIFLIKMYRYEKDKFANYNLENEIENLSSEDLNYLKILQNNAKQYKNIVFDDEIDLFYSAIDLLNLKNNKDKYELLNQLKCDFQNNKKKNETINEEEKIKIVKRRIEIFKETKENIGSKKTQCGLKYYKKALLSKTSVT